MLCLVLLFLITNEQTSVYTKLQTRKHYSYLALLVLCVSSMLSCASSETELTVDEDAWRYEERAIIIEINAPSDLNARSGRPHALSLGVFQLSDPNTFSGLAATQQGSVELLRKGRIDETVSDFRRVTVQPGEKKTIVLSRAAKAKFIGIISGYFELNPNQDVNLFDVPVVANSRGVVDKALSLTGLIADEAEASPAPIHLRVDLGRAGTKQVIIDDSGK